jgi:mRNA interferase MazF
MTASTKPIERFDIYWVDLDPTKGSEIRKTRPCIVVSPNEMNDLLRTVVVAPLTSTVVAWPFRTTISLAAKQPSVACDQIRAISKDRLRDRVGSLSSTEQEAVLGIVQAMFAK